MKYNISEYNRSDWLEEHQHQWESKHPNSEPDRQTDWIMLEYQLRTLYIFRIIMICTKEPIFLPHTTHAIHFSCKNVVLSSRLEREVEWGGLDWTSAGMTGRAAEWVQNTTSVSRLHKRVHAQQ